MREAASAVRTAGSLSSHMAENLSASPRPRIAVLAALAVLALAAIAMLVSASRADAATCNIDPDNQAYWLPNSNGYITSLTVSRSSCKTGRTVAQAFFKCRHKKGKEGRCTDKVRGYSCREGKRSKIATELNARVTCTLGKRKITHTYQQNL